MEKKLHQFSQAELIGMLAVRINAFWESHRMQSRVEVLNPERGYAVSVGKSGQSTEFYSINGQEVEAYLLGIELGYVTTNKESALAH